ncbi:imidazole glycerol phosphate synthase subunit HisH [Pelotomaculum propionicicum]|uniref:Imidazole glycerol phosphate synthase subunit HisH n=1 Tax=Pelotomaculum propionicicum TaxID=258475 RepID=A0A4Y7RPV1_9FIRM|nr:imidazole glycerol phosphate synthase subunit HisH [Pelotomaculum propionicicum]NLI14305.1 imidazole glycerol phosphate synthase subunit HisH [Peptococcaceae bacterium]TEB10881.1 Imidazole glycerol phosphate synthase subunit HisH [Pelotomaculum propionicicum]
MIAIIDYGMGNLRSVYKGFEKVGVKAAVVSDPSQVDQADGVVLPGVGAFADAMANLRAAGMVEVILQAIKEGKPFLGICLGQQLLFDASEEWGYTQGLGIFPGQVRRLPEGLKVPHMGWNQIEIARPDPLLDGIPDRSSFYFVHSYAVEPVDAEITLTLTEYGVHFASIVGKNKVYGIQFHPEKSSALGLKILENFGRVVKTC